MNQLAASIDKILNFKNVPVLALYNSESSRPSQAFLALRFFCMTAFKND